MKYTQLKKSIAEGAMPIYLFEGEEAYFRNGGVEALKKAFVSEPSFNFASFDGGKKQFREIISAVYSYPLMSEKRLVKISELYLTEKEYEKLGEIFSSPSESTIVAIVNSSKPKAGGCDLKKKPNVTYVDCSSAEEEDVVKWIYINLKRAGVYADVSVCSRISAYCCGNMERVSKETEKLIAYAGEGGKITEEVVDAVVYKEEDYKIYELTNALSRRDYGKFMYILKDLQSKGYDEIRIMNTLGLYYKGLYECYICPLKNADAAKLLSVKEFVVKKNREQASGIGIEKVKSFFNVFYGGIADVKSGKLSPSAALTATTAKIFFNDG